MRLKCSKGEDMGIWSVKKFQEKLEDCVKKKCLPLPPIYDWEAQLMYEAYLTIDNKQAKHALLIQLAYVLTGLRLRNPTKRFETILNNTKIDKSFAYQLLYAYTNQKEGFKHV